MKKQVQRVGLNLERKRGNKTLFLPISISFLRARKGNLIKMGVKRISIAKRYFCCSAFHCFALFCAEQHPLVYYFISISINFFS